MHFAMAFEPPMTAAVSVVMPVHNAGPYLARAVDSILSQTYVDFEFLIIDDGSTDRSRATLERRSDPRGARSCRHGICRL